MPTLIEPDYTGSSQHFAFLIARQEQLCHALEHLADRLPDQIDTLAAKTLAEALHPTLRACQSIEEAYVFPRVLEKESSFAPMIERLRAEHVEDEDHALIVAEAILGFLKSPQNAEADRLGYLIRGLFQPLLRHAAYDRDIVLPLLRQSET